MRETARVLSIALASAMLLVPRAAHAESPDRQQREPVVLSKGLRGSIGDGRLGRTRLIFTDDSLTVDVVGGTRERFEYNSLRLVRGQHHKRLPLFDKWSLAVWLPSVALAVATGGLSEGASSLLWMVSGSSAWYLVDRLFRIHRTHWLSLHSDTEHRSAFLMLPRSGRLRRAIFAELEQRDEKKLLVRPAPSRAHRDHPAFPLEGEPAPGFDLPTLEGLRWRLSEARGKVVLLNFWAIWCGPCRKELPHLERLHQRYAKDGLAVVGVSSEEPDDATVFLRENGVTYTALNDHRGRVFERYQVDSIPTSLIVGPNGTLLKRIEGYRNEKAFYKAIKPYLAPKP